VYLTLQGFNFLIFIFVGILLFLFRKEKELKYRSWLPYFSIFGLFILSIRLGLGNLSILKIGNKESYTFKFFNFFSQHSFSCWWDLVILAPVNKISFYF
jgi:hypothetical protein